MQGQISKELLADDRFDYRWLQARRMDPWGTAAPAGGTVCWKGQEQACQHQGTTVNRKHYKLALRGSNCCAGTSEGLRTAQCGWVIARRVGGADRHSARLPALLCGLWSRYTIYTINHRCKAFFSSCSMIIDKNTILIICMKQCRALILSLLDGTGYSVTSYQIFIILKSIPQQRFSRKLWLKALIPW